MKTKAERRLTKRLRRDHAQISEDCNDPDHPLYIFAAVEIQLILAYKEECEKFDFEYPRILRQVHDFYGKKAHFSSILFEELIRTEWFILCRETHSNTSCLRKRRFLE